VTSASLRALRRASPGSSSDSETTGKPPTSAHHALWP